MADENDSALRRAVERVIREYRAHHEVEVKQSVQGLTVEMRHDLAVALDDLETVFDGEQDGRESEPPAFTVLEGDLVRDIYAIRGIARALDVDGAQGGLIFGLQGIADRVVDGLGSVTPEIEDALSRVVKVCQ